MQIRYAPQPVDINPSLFIFDLENETLIDADNAVRTDAISGPYGKGPLPKGQYMMKPAVLIDADDESNKGFMDKRGLAWWAALVPSFETHRTGLGIHPDGNVEGTLGCIGITVDDTRTWFQRLEKPAIVMVV